MDRRNRFAAETVRKVQQSLEEVPPYEATELTKQQTIRALAPHILALRAKGYGWTAVAAMLSERGVPVSAAALRTYLRRVPEGTLERREHTSERRPRDARGRIAQPELRAPRAEASAQTSEATSQTAPMPSGAAAKPPIVTQPAAAPPARREGPMRRDMFVARPDTEDI
jgi:hypothetical protein